MYVVLDIDGTVVDHRARVYGLYAEYGRMQGKPVLDEGRYFAKKRRGTSERSIAAETFPAELLGPYLAWKRARIEAADALERDVLVPGMGRALEVLSSSYSLVALSARQSNDALIYQLAGMGVWRLFETSLPVRAGSLVEAKAAALGSFLSRGRISADDVVLIGDSEVEIATAERCGTRCVSVAWGLRNRSFLLRHGAHIVARSGREVCHVVRLWLGTSG